MRTTVAVAPATQRGGYASNVASSTATRRFPIYIGSVSRWFLFVIGVRKSTAWVDVGPAGIHAQFGFFRVRRSLDEIASWRLEGKWHWASGIGVRYRPSRHAVAFTGSFVPGVTLVLTRPGKWLMLHFDELYITVEDPDGFAKALTELGINKAAEPAT